jgi:hypothetical protein
MADVAPGRRFAGALFAALPFAALLPLLSQL